MKTNRKNQKTGLPSRPEQSSTDKNPNTAQSASAPSVSPTAERPPLPQLDFAKRREYRELPTDRVLELLRTEAPRFFQIAEVVGKWVWIQFTDKQPREVTGALSQLGFHWNNKRQAWQHPCGAFTGASSNDPREKYRSFFPADAKAA